MLNKCCFIGRLGKDPEIRMLDSGIAVATFSIATTKSYRTKDTGEKREITEWHNLVLWRGLAEVAAKYLKKGDLIYVEGEHSTRSWEKDGITRYTSEFVCQEMKMLSTKGSSNRTPPPEVSGEAEVDRTSRSTGKSKGKGKKDKTMEDDDYPNMSAHVDSSTDDLPF